MMSIISMRILDYEINRSRSVAAPASPKAKKGHAEFRWLYPRRVQLQTAVWPLVGAARPTNRTARVAAGGAGGRRGRGDQQGRRRPSAAAARGCPAEAPALQPAAEGRTDYWRDQDSEAKERHRHALFLNRKGIQQHTIHILRQSIGGAALITAATTNEACHPSSSNTAKRSCRALWRK
jgi:hypothetical protein